MCKLVLDRGASIDFTSVSNIFIDEYMPKANGEFVKIYLHLLRLVGAGASAAMELSTERIAEKFSILESDVYRALDYWAQEKLVSLTFNDSNQLSGIRMESFINITPMNTNVIDMDSDSDIIKQTSTKTLAKASGESVSAPVPEATGYVIPAKKKYSASEISKFSDDEDVAQLIFVAEKYLGKTLTSNDINSILYMLEGLNFDVNFIEYIMETCISSGHKSLSAMEKQAVAYAKKGISSALEAKEDQQLRKAVFKSIYKIFGFEEQTPAKRDLSFVKKWTGEYGFSDELIIEACNRTMAKTHSGSFEYTDGILTNWFKNKAKTMADVEILDNAHSKKMEETYNNKASFSRPKKKKTASFEQHDYDFDELERQLSASNTRKLQAYKSASSKDN